MTLATLPVRHRLLSATVLQERCALADAWATALMVVAPSAPGSSRTLPSSTCSYSSPPQTVACIVERATAGFDACRAAALQSMQ